MKLKIIISICFFLWSLISFAQEIEVEIEGAIKIGNYTGDTTQSNAGIIRWSGSDFEGWNGLNWRSLTSYILTSGDVVLPPPTIILPPVASAPSSPLNNPRWTEGPLWTIDGNFINGNFDPSYYNIPYPRMGTTDNFPVVYITNNVERMRMRVDGDITINRSVYLNTDQPGTQTINNGPFTVTNMSPSLLSGILTVNKRTRLNSMLEVFGPAKLNNTLLVDNKGIGLFPSELKGAVKISEVTQSDGAIEQGDPVQVVVDASRGALVVDGGAGIGKNFNVGGDFAVRGSTAFGGPVSFYNPLSIKASEESETLWVGDSITGALRVYGGTGIRGKLNVGNDFSVQLRREGPLPSSDTIDVFKVNATTGQVTIKTNLFPTPEDLVPVILPGPNSTHDMSFDNYPLRIEGGSQGFAVKINGNRSNNNNFMSFWDDSQMWGRIEGETPPEFINSAGYLLSTKGLAYTEFSAGVALGFATANTALAAGQLIKEIVDFRPCIGFGLCIAFPGPAKIAFAIVEVASAGVQLGFAVNTLNRAKELTSIFNTNKTMLEGVTYKSGAGDYAEYLLRAGIDEKISPGDIVGVFGGTVSKNTTNAEMLMVVSSKPIVLGNIPQPGMEEHYEKIAFMGQVPVKVFGKVAIGDYIVPSGNNDGIGKAIHPSEITSENIKNIVGIAWTKSEVNFGYNLITVAVGLNRNDNNPIVEKLESNVQEQDIEIDNIKSVVKEAFATIARIEEREVGTASARTKSHSIHNQDDIHGESGIYNNRKYELINTKKGEVISWEITEEDFEEALVLLEKIYRENNLDFENNIVFKQIKNDLNYKNQMFESVKEKLIEEFLEHNEKYHNGEKH
jgi:hypothetical protein